MYNYDKVMSGLSKFIDTEIVNKVPGWKKWLVGSAMGIMLSNSSSIFEQLNKNSFIKTLNLIDDLGNINVDELYKELKKQAQKSNATIELPMIGSFVLNEQDVDKLYKFITME